jgi:flagellar motor switch protein FliM
VPLLKSALESTASACADELRAKSSLPVRVALLDIRTGAAGDLLAAHGEDVDNRPRGNVVCGVLDAPGWDAQLVACAGRDAVQALVELMLGGDISLPAHVDDRPLTRIEMAVTGALFGDIGSAFAASLAGGGENAITLAGTSGAIDDEVLGRQDAVLAARFRLDVLGRSSDVVLAIPQPVAGRMGKALAAAAPKAAPPRPDSRWTRNIQHELNRASVQISATLEERMGILGEITNLSVGQVIQLDATPQSRVQVECNGERLMWCHLGKSNGFYTLRVDAFVDREQEFMNDILAV